MPPAPPSAIGSKRRVSNWGTAVRQSCLVGLFVWRGREGGGGVRPVLGVRRATLALQPKPGLEPFFQVNFSRPRLSF